jgi:hypothetical protein
VAIAKTMSSSSSLPNMLRTSRLFTKISITTNSTATMETASLTAGVRTGIPADYLGHASFMAEQYNLLVVSSSLR